MAGFGKNSGPFAFGTAAGPSLPPQTLPLFGASIPQSPSPSPSPTPPPNNPTPPHHQSQRLGTHTHFPLDNRPPEALKRTRSPPSVYGGNRSIVYPQEETQGLGTRTHFPPNNRHPEALKRTRSPPLVYGGNHSIVYPQEETQGLGTRTHFPLDNRPPEALKRTRSPPLVYGGNRSIGYPQEETQGLGTRTHFPPDNRPPEALKRTQSPPLVYGGNHSIVYSQEETQGLGTHTHFPLDNRPPEALKRTRSPPLVYGGNRSIVYPQEETQGLGTRMHFPPDNRPPEASKRTRSPPLVYGGNHSIVYPQEESQGPSVSPQRGIRPKSPVNIANAQVQERPLLSYADLDNPGSRFPIVPPDFQAQKRTRSPPLPLPDKVSFENLQHAQGNTERPAGYAKLARTKSPVNDANAQVPWSTSLITPYVDQDDPRTRFLSRPANFRALKWTRSPPLPSADKVPMGNLTAESSKAPQGMQPPPLAFESNRFDNELHYPFEEAQRSAISPPTWGSQPKSPVSHANSQNHQKYLLGATGVDPNNPDAGTRVPTKSANFQVPKRTGSPILSSAEVLLESSPSIQDDGEREAQAKAKRLARFRVELSQPPLGLYDPTKNKVPGNTHDQAPEEKQRVVTKLRLEEVGDFPNINTSFDSEGLHATNAVIGLCLDMCPESEREERERKGDLDKYERLDGDRNQTSKSIAVKKYNRTAEREAELIRPMPVLQKTIDYLLGLLDQPYDEKFLGMYNFLWDRMRAIRMDLRMQHIFNRDAITMLEQMIRLHIIAMHELCEYTKGEGFSEGFDAHLNIEQMNKASAELFQLYDDHRKKGISVPSEKEFRGYYALLKLDRHPGYKVEPAELSLDLAKMPREIRSTPEVIFARDVARACRTGNFIVFFQLARRATYLQACLMHAHFTKELFRYAQDRKAKVITYSERVGDQVLWGPAFRRILFEVEESQLFALLGLLRLVHIPEGMDRRIWTHYTDGSFSVASFFVALMTRSSSL